MPTTTVNLTDGLHEWIAAKVASGNYNNASEVIRESLRLLRNQEKKQALELEYMRRKVMTGLTEAERGEFSSKNVEDIFEEIKTL